MKKLTKTQKQNLKKKLLRTFNIIGLIVGGLSFIVVLYAIIAGGLAANNSETTTAEVSEAVSPTPKTIKAQSPPSSYDLELSSQLVGGQYLFLWTSSAGSDEAHFIEYDTPSVYYQNIQSFNGLTITTNVFAPTTTILTRDAENGVFAFRGDYIGSAASSPAFRRFSFTLDNRNSPQSFLFYADFSSSVSDLTTEVSFTYNNNVVRLNNITFNYNNLRPLYVPPYSRIVLPFFSSTSAQYLDRIYIDDIGSTAYDIGFDDGEYFGGENGYDWGYEVGLEDGYDTGYSDGLDVGYTGGYEDGYFDASESNIPYTYEEGYEDGYAEGLADASESGGAIGNAFDLIYAGAASVDRILSINVFGSITLGMLLFTPLIIGIALAVIKIIKG